MSGADQCWMNREIFTEEVARLRHLGHKVTVWWSEATGHLKAVFVQEDKVILLEQWERVVVYYGDDRIDYTLDVVLYERGHRPKLVSEVQYR